MNDRLIPVEWLPQYTYADYETWEGDWELIEGIPYSLMPSSKRTHQSTARKFVRSLEDALLKTAEACNCEVFYELDWIVNDTTVVRPDIMIACGDFEEDFLRFPPTLIVEVTYKRTQMFDRDVKFKIYETNGVPYYLIADTEKGKTDVFQLADKQYRPTETALFTLTDSCQIAPDMQKP